VDKEQVDQELKKFLVNKNNSTVNYGLCYIYLTLSTIYKN